MWGVTHDMPDRKQGGRHGCRILRLKRCIYAKTIVQSCRQRFLAEKMQVQRREFSDDLGVRVIQRTQDDSIDANWDLFSLALFLSSVQLPLFERFPTVKLLTLFGFFDAPNKELSEILALELDGLGYGSHEAI
jgi:hypothetical protein